jgi:hypothetical protein
VESTISHSQRALRPLDSYTAGPESVSECCQILANLYQNVRTTVDAGAHTRVDGAWAMRPLELARNAGWTMLVLEDAGGEPLDRLLGVPMEVGRFLRMAIGIAVALAKLHQRGLVHKDIQEGHQAGQYLLNGATCEVRLTGFGIASRLAREASRLTLPPARSPTWRSIRPDG